MSMKKLLGLDALPIGDEEVMRRMQEAFEAGQEEVVFTAGSHKVKVKLCHTSSQGCMRDYEQYY